MRGAVCCATAAASCSPCRRARRCTRLMPWPPWTRAGTARSAGNPIYRLARVLQRLADYQFPVQLNEVSRAFFERSAAIETGQLADDMRGVLKDPPDSGSVARLSAVPFYNSKLRTTCVATMLAAGHAENALPQAARATVNCRILPGEPTAGDRRP